jgi:hypothetical protein
MGGLDWKMEGRKLNFQLCMTFAYRSTCYLFYGFPPLNTVYVELELEETVSELMTCHEVHDGGDLVWKMEGKKLKEVRCSNVHDICLSFQVLFILRFPTPKHGPRRA